MSQKKRLNKSDYTVGWICAIPIERAAARLVLDETHGIPYQYYATSRNQANNVYEFGAIEAHNVVIAGLPAGEYGITTASRVANQFQQDFPELSYRFFVGIAGGAPTPSNDVRLGDVVVSVPQDLSSGVVQYDAGKTTAGGEFQIRSVLNQPDSTLRQAVHLAQSQLPIALSGDVSSILRYSLDLNPDDRFILPSALEDNLYEPDYLHVSAPAGQTFLSQASQSTDWSQPIPVVKSECKLYCDASKIIRRPPRTQTKGQSLPKIHFGLIGSGNQVMKDGITRNRVQANTNILCFEMEAAGVMNVFPCLVVRGICDYSDSHKSKEWQPYAAGIAAAFTKQLLLLCAPIKPRTPSPPRHSRPYNRQEPYLNPYQDYDPYQRRSRSRNSYDDDRPYPDDFDPYNRPASHSGIRTNRGGRISDGFSPPPPEPSRLYSQQYINQNDGQGYGISTGHRSTRSLHDQNPYIYPSTKERMGNMDGYGYGGSRFADDTQVQPSGRGRGRENDKLRVQQEHTQKYAQGERAERFEAAQRLGVRPKEWETMRDERSWRDQSDEVSSHRRAPENGPWAGYLPPRGPAGPPARTESVSDRDELGYTSEENRYQREFATGAGARTSDQMRGGRGTSNVTEKVLTRTQEVDHEKFSTKEFRGSSSRSQGPSYIDERDADLTNENASADSNRPQAMEPAEKLLGGKEHYTVCWLCSTPADHSTAICMLDERNPSPPNLALDRGSKAGDFAFGRIGSHLVVMILFRYHSMPADSLKARVRELSAEFANLKYHLLVGTGGGAFIRRVRLGDIVVGVPTNGNESGVLKFSSWEMAASGKLEITTPQNRVPKSLLEAFKSTLETADRTTAPPTPEGYSGYEDITTVSEDVVAEIIKREKDLAKHWSRTKFKYPEHLIDVSFEADYHHGQTEESAADKNGPILLKPGANKQTCDQVCNIARTWSEVNWLRHHRNDQNWSPPMIWGGLIASVGQGESPHDARGRDAIQNRYPDILCFDEALAELVDALPCLVIKGISNYADTHQYWDWEPYATATACAFAKILLQKCPSVISDGDLSKLILNHNVDIKSKMSELHKGIDNMSKFLSDIHESFPEVPEASRTRNQKTVFSPQQNSLMSQSHLETHPSVDWDKFPVDDDYETRNRKYRGEGQVVEEPQNRGGWRSPKSNFSPSSNTLDHSRGSLAGFPSVLSDPGRDSARQAPRAPYLPNHYSDSLYEFPIPASTYGDPSDRPRPQKRDQHDNPQRVVSGPQTKEDMQTILKRQRDTLKHRRNLQRQWQLSPEEEEEEEEEAYWDPSTDDDMPSPFQTRGSYKQRDISRIRSAPPTAPPAMGSSINIGGSVNSGGGSVLIGSTLNGGGTYNFGSPGMPPPAPRGYSTNRNVRPRSPIQQPARDSRGRHDEEHMYL